MSQCSRPTYCIFARGCAAAPVPVTCNGEAELDARVGGGEDVPDPTIVKELCAGAISDFELMAAEDAGAVGAVSPVCNTDERTGDEL